MNLKFEELEQSIYDYVCRLARDITVEVLTGMDEHLKTHRDRKRYKCKDRKTTTIKTVYGEVEYQRNYYFDLEEGRYIYLLDDEIQMEKIGMVSSNLAKKITEACIDMPFRKAAKTISETTAQSISSRGAWNVVQQVGKTVKKDENNKVKNLGNDKKRGKKKADIIFMEADGVYLKIQKDKKKAKSQELKLATIYEGWKDRRLYGKTVFIGMDSADKFNEKAEALVQSVYDTDNSIRILNGDGAAWISNTYEPYRIFQLDRFHIIKKIRQCIKDKNITRIAIKQFYDKDYDGLYDTIEAYYNSVISGGHTKKTVELATDLRKYLVNNRDGIASWQEQLEDIPIPPEGITYKNMGVQEGQNCSLVTNRMKGQKMRWSVSGADNMAKLIYTRENGTLDKYIEKYDGYVETDDIDVIAKKIAAKDNRERIGSKGSKYIELIQAHIPCNNVAEGAYSKLLRNISH